MEKGPGPSNLSPPRRNPSGKFIGSSQKTIIVNLYKNVVSEKPNMKYEPLIRLLSKQTGFGLGTIQKTLAEYKSTGEVKSPNRKKPRLTILEKLSAQDLTTIHEKVEKFRANQKTLSMKKLLEEINNDLDIPNFSKSTLYRLLKSLGLYPKDAQKNSNENCTSVSSKIEESAKKHA